jgi:hypothetical protein
MKIVTLLVAASFVWVALPAHAGVCTKEIEMITQLLSGGGGSAPSVGSAAPAAPGTSTLSSVAGGGAAAGALGSAAPAASPEALESVEQAKAADAAGDETSCMEYIGKAKELLGLVQ